jgi:hypothetical protein
MTAPKERPLLVSGPLIGPILRGEKTVTRRLLKPKPYDSPDINAVMTADGRALLGALARAGIGDKWRCPFGAVGDVLWVRETWALVRLDYDWETGHCDDCEGVERIPSADPRIGDSRHQPRYSVAYAASEGWEADIEDRGFPWRPSIHMPRWAARVFLRVESVTVERVQDINVDDIVSEGVLTPAEVEEGCALPAGEIQAYLRPKFAAVWDSVAPAGSKWADNPWVWRIGFAREAR